MIRELPRIETVTAVGPTTIDVTWRSGSSDRINLAGWISTGRDLLARLGDPKVFGAPRIDDYGAAVSWSDNDDLAIDAFHLQQLAEEQRPFRREEITAWQDAMRLSNQEAADFLHIALSTWNSYKAGANIPETVAMLCRAARRDPILMQAHYRPRKTGRPRKLMEAH